MEDQPTTNLSKFTDVKADDYFAKAVAWAKANGIVSGVSDTEFAPNDKITREQMATIIYRYAVYKEKGPEGAWAIRMDYKDLSDISDYAGEAVMFFKLMDIMSGNENNEFNTLSNATRAEMTVVIERIAENLIK